MDAEDDASYATESVEGFISEYALLMATSLFNAYIPWFLWLTFTWSPSVSFEFTVTYDTVTPPLIFVIPTPVLLYASVLPVPVVNVPWTLSRTNSLIPKILEIESLMLLPRVLPP